MLPKAILAIAALAFSPANALWPIPQKITTGDSVLFIDEGVRVTYNGVQVCNRYNTPFFGQTRYIAVANTLAIDYHNRLQPTRWF